MMETTTKMERGYAMVAVESPKSEPNLGGVLRAAGVFGAAGVVFGRPRCKVRYSTDTMKAYRHIPVQRVEDIMAAVPFDCVPIAVDILPGAVPLPEFEHPERGFYIFGAEDQTLGARITDRCAASVIIPSRRCLNLAAAVNVVLYDRVAKALLRAMPDRNAT